MSVAAFVRKMTQEDVWVHDFERNKKIRISRVEVLAQLSNLAQFQLQSIEEAAAAISDVLEYVDSIHKIGDDNNKGLRIVHNNLMQFIEETNKNLHEIRKAASEARDASVVASICAGVALAASLFVAAFVAFRKTPADRVIRDVKILNTSLHSVAEQNNHIYDSVQKTQRMIRGHDKRLETTLGAMFQSAKTVTPSQQVMN